MDSFSLLDIMRSSLVFGAAVYIIYAFDGMMFLNHNRRLYREDKYRISLSVVSSFFALLIFVFTFSEGSLYNSHLFLPSTFLVGSVAIFLYSNLLRRYLMWSKYVVPLIAVSSLVTFVIAGFLIVHFLITESPMGWEFTQDKTISNTFVLASFGPYTYKPLFAGGILTAIASLTSIIVLVSLTAAILTKRNNDKYIIAGILFTFTAMIAEIAIPLLIPEYIFTVYFAANIPEIIRVSFLSRQAMIAEMVSKEKETILAFSGTIRHELNTPLAKLGSYIALTQKTGDTNSLKKCDDVLESVSNILIKLDSFAASRLSKEDYRAPGEVGEKTSEIYSLKDD
ncbi:hypothetical protein N9W79_02440 [bacterium]|nr:hypothetical protein [bacterium]